MHEKEVFIESDTGSSDEKHYSFSCIHQATLRAEATLCELAYDK